MSKISLDSLKRLRTTFVGIDAAIFYGPLKNQLEVPHILRDLAKAFIGFSGVTIDPAFEEEKRLKVITGKWGCGIFGGMPELKLLIQWIAASMSGREMIFTTF